MSDEPPPDWPGVRDLMPFLKQKNPMVGSAVDPPAAEGEDDEDAVEVEEEEEAKPSRFPEGPMNDFFEVVKAVTDNIEYIEWVAPKYAVAAHAFTSAVDVTSAKEAEDKVNAMVKQSKTIMKKNKKSIDEMDETLKAQMREDADALLASGELEKADYPKIDDGDVLEHWSAPYRVMNSCRWALVGEWKRVNKKYNEEQASCDRRKRANLVRQLTIANGQEPSDEEVTKRLNNNATDVFSGGMVARSADADADFANEFLQEAQEEAAKMTEILKGMREMQQMWDEFQLLLQKQGEMLNTISGNLAKAKDFVKAANEDLAEAQEHADAANRQQMLIIASCCIGACVLIIPMLIGSGIISV